MVTRRKWTEEEDNALFKLLSENSTNLRSCFRVFASKNNRTASAVEEHWYYTLRPKYLEQIQQATENGSFGMMDKMFFAPLRKNTYTTLGAQEEEVILEHPQRLPEKKRSILSKIWSYIKRII